jgi:ADP-heptose:LPS heptosyltransferase
MQKKFYNLILTAVVYLGYVIRGHAKKIPENIQTFVVINVTGNIGDMVCTTPVFRAIKKGNPRPRLVVVGVPKNALMLSGNTDIDEYIETSDSFISMVRAIRRVKPNVGIMINPSILDFSQLFLAGVSSISCFTLTEEYRGAEARSYSAVSKFGIQTEYIPGKYVPRQYIRLLAPYNLDSDDIQKHLGFTEIAKKKIIDSLCEAHIQEGEKVVAIAPGAGTKIKQWPAERFGEVANYIAERYGMGIVIIGGPRDKEEIEKMKAQFHNTVRYCDFGSQSLDELKAALSVVALVIGNDSGPIYIAESFGAATMVLVGPTDELEHPLQDDTHMVIMAREKGEALLQSNVSSEETIELNEARSQIEAITVEEVCNGIDNLFHHLKIEPYA